MFWEIILFQMLELKMFNIFVFLYLYVYCQFISYVCVFQKQVNTIPLTLGEFHCWNSFVVGVTNL